ncbi:hypothetical protein [Terrabacter lapilli]|uniref:hypothetical protein n=1 Tax=Terrabacter lapilli TaxID=436231 RepID=UPI0031D3CBA1
MANASRRSARARALQTLRSPRTYAVCAAVALLAGCGRVSALEPGSSHATTGFGVVAIDPGTGPANPPTARVPADFKVERRTWGGMCAGGACGSMLTVVADGTWVQVVQGKRTTGTLTRKQVVDLMYNVMVTQGRVDHARKAQHPATGKADCAADHDGTSMAYAWTLAGRSDAVSSCDPRRMPVDDVAFEMEEIADSISH